MDRGHRDLRDRKVGSNVDLSIFRLLTAITFLLFCRYSSAADELLTTVRKTEDSLKRLKKQFKRPGAAANAAEDGVSVSDEDKIRMQILLDVKQFGEEVAALGVSIEGNPSYEKLVEVTSEQTAVAESAEN